MNFDSMVASTPKGFGTTNIVYYATVTAVQGRVVQWQNE